MSRPTLFTDEIKTKIIHQYFTTSITVRELAVLFCTSHMTIQRIVTSKLAQELYKQPKPHKRPAEYRPLTLSERVRRAEIRFHNKLMAETPRDMLLDPVTGKTLAQLDEEKIEANLTDEERANRKAIAKWSKHNG